MLERFIKLAVLSFICLFFIVMTISAFIPSNVRISRAINIKSSADSVLSEINDLNKWKKWYPGFDTLVLEPLTLKDGRMLSAKMKTTTISVTQLNPNEVSAKFETIDKNPVVGGWKAISHNQSDSLTVQWYLDFKLKWYPWDKFFSLAYDKMYGAQMEQGLAKLKKNAEQ
jgi:hypothetical protein